MEAGSTTGTSAVPRPFVDPTTGGAHGSSPFGSDLASGSGVGSGVDSGIGSGIGSGVGRDAEVGEDTEALRIEAEDDARARMAAQAERALAKPPERGTPRVIEGQHLGTRGEHGPVSAPG